MAIQVSCPVCSEPPVKRPFRLRHELVQCRNCTAWIRIPTAAPDETLAKGELVAAPGQPIPQEHQAAAVATNVPLLRARWLGIGLAANGALAALALLLVWLARDRFGGDPYGLAWVFGPALALAHVTAGFLIGWRSPGETIAEPALAGLVAGAAGAFVLRGTAAFPVELLVAGALAAGFAALGGALGERVQKRG